MTESTANSRAKKLIEEGEDLFGKRATLVSLWQEIADHFYVERADFTVERTIGTTFAENLMTSYPLLCRRDLGNRIGAMLRPRTKDWFAMTVSREDRLDDAGRVWLDDKTKVMRRAIADRSAQFTRATKEADHDYASFGQCVISAELNLNGDALLYRCWHLRDVVWCESAEGRVDTVHRRWKPPAIVAAALFPNASSKVKQLAEKQPYETVELRHIVLPSERYNSAPGGKKWRHPYVSIFLEMDTQTILEEAGSSNLRYVIPRWQTVSGSQYAYSPAAVAALPDARLIQAMTLTLLEAGERMTNPPMIAVQEAIRSDVQLYAGGITWVDAEYDERLGEVLRPLTQDKSGMPIGRDLRNDVRDIIKEAFFLNTLAPLPQTDNPEMTAFEVGQRIQDYIAKALPIFEPIEDDYNGGLCEITADILMRGGAFGALADIPQSIRGQELQFRFESPLTQAVDAQKAGKLGEAKQLLAQVADLDPTSAQILDAKQALRDLLRGIGVPERWLRTQKQMDAIQQEAARRQQAQELLAGMQQSANIGKTIAQAQATATSADTEAA